MSNDGQRAPQPPRNTARRNEAIAVLYAQRAGGLRRAVSCQVTAPAVLVDDACQTAWTRLCGRVEVDVESPGVIGWLLRTAVREASRQAARQQAPAEASGED